MIYFLTVIGLSPGGSSTVHIYTQIIYRTTQITTNVEECGPCPVFASFILAFALQLREKKQGKSLVRVRKTSVGTPELFWPGCEVDCTSSNAKVKNEWSYTCVFALRPFRVQRGRYILVYFYVV
jgi:hypothetical protein